ncbi:MAG: metallophosphoesterase family protein [Boseongicola sp.]
MRLAVISDIHANIDALNAVLEDIARHEVSDMVCLGDCLSGPMDAPATAERLMALNIPTVRGNHDRQLFDRPRAEMRTWENYIIDDLSEEHINWLRTFPVTYTHGDVLFCHATPDNDEENWLDFRGPGQRLIARDLPGVVDRLCGITAPVICCGHTHTPRIVHIPNGPMIVNPGAIGIPAYLDERNDPPFIHQTGSPDARYAILENFGDRWHADLISVPYDTSRMVRLARGKGADSWAQALETGWIA